MGATAGWYYFKQLRLRVVSAGPRCAPARIGIDTGPWGKHKWTAAHLPGSCAARP